MTSLSAGIAPLLYRRLLPAALLLLPALPWSGSVVLAETTPPLQLAGVPESPSEVNPVGVGEKAPSAKVTSPDGTEVVLSDLYSSAPTVLIFYRGGWCPYCNTHLASLAKVERELADAGYQIVALSPDAPGFLQETAEKSEGGYRLLSDSDAEAARAFGLAFRVDDATFQRYRGFKTPIDLEARSGRRHHILLVPAAYVVDQTGTIRYAYWNPEYKQRIDARELLKAALEAR